MQRFSTRILFVLSVLAVLSTALAQQIGGGGSGSGSGSGTPPGTNGQLSYNNGGVWGAFTLGGDCTLNVTTGALICTKTNGVAFGALATQSTVNLATQSTGTPPVVPNRVTSGPYPVAPSDNGGLVVFDSTSPIAVTMPGATTSGFGSGASFYLTNANTGAVTVSFTTSTLNGGSSVVLHKNESLSFASDGANYYGGVFVIPYAVNTDVWGGVSTSTLVTPGALAASAVPQTLTCSSNAATWNLASGYNAIINLTASGAGCYGPTITISGTILQGITYTMWLVQPAAGSILVTSYPSQFDWGAAGTPTLSTVGNSVDMVTCAAYSTSKLHCTINKGF